MCRTNKLGLNGKKIGIATKNELVDNTDKPRDPKYEKPKVHKPSVANGIFKKKNCDD